MGGMLWCQRFCLLMRRELSFLTVCNFLVWPWQLAFVKQINPQHSPRCCPSGLGTPHTLGAPWSFFSPCLLPLQFSHLPLPRWPGWCFFYFLFTCSLSLLSPFFFLLLNTKICTFLLPPPLDFTSLFSSVRTSGCSPFPHFRTCRSFLCNAALWTCTSLPWPLRYFLPSAKKSLGVSAGYSGVSRRGQAGSHQCLTAFRSTGWLI